MRFCKPLCLLGSLLLFATACQKPLEAAQLALDSIAIDSAQLSRAQTPANASDSAEIEALPVEITGTYQLNDENKPKMGGKIQVLKAASNRVQFLLLVSDSSKNKRKPMLGEVEGLAALVQHTATYKTNMHTGNTCELTLEFGPDWVEVQQKGGESDCGLLQGLAAGGRYRKIDGEKPSFR